VKFFEYDGEVILEQEADWDTIVGCIFKDLHILEDYHHGSNTDKSLELIQEELVHEKLFK
jgi:hypothetical protein